VHCAGRIVYRVDCVQGGLRTGWIVYRVDCVHGGLCARSDGLRMTSRHVIIHNYSS